MKILQTTINGCHFGGHLEYLHFYKTSRVKDSKFEFSDPENLGLEPKMIALAPIEAEIWWISVDGGHLGRHLEYLKTLKGDKVASIRFGFSTLELPNISNKTLCILRNTPTGKITIWLPDYCIRSIIKYEIYIWHLENIFWFVSLMVW